MPLGILIFPRVTNGAVFHRKICRTVFLRRLGGSTFFTGMVCYSARLTRLITLTAICTPKLYGHPFRLTVDLQYNHVRYLTYQFPHTAGTLVIPLASHMGSCIEEAPMTVKKCMVIGSAGCTLLLISPANAREFNLLTLHGTLQFQVEAARIRSGFFLKSCAPLNHMMRESLLCLLSSMVFIIVRFLNAGRPVAISTVGMNFFIRAKVRK